MTHFSSPHTDEVSRINMTPTTVSIVSYAWEAWTNTFNVSKPVPPENIFCAWCGIRQSAVGDPMKHTAWHDEVDKKLGEEL
jgi:hypothetical protein